MARDRKCGVVMKKKLKMLPEPFRRSVLYRWSFGMASFISAAAVFLIFHDMSLAFPFVVIAAILAIQGIELFFRAYAGDYICVRGRCTKTGYRQGNFWKWKRSLAYVDLDTPKGTVRLMVNQGKIKVSAGDGVEAYIRTADPVYEKDGLWIISRYLVLSVKRKDSINI